MCVHRCACACTFVCEPVFNVLQQCFYVDLLMGYLVLFIPPCVHSSILFTSPSLQFNSSHFSSLNISVFCFVHLIWLPQNLFTKDKILLFHDKYHSLYTHTHYRHHIFFIYSPFTGLTYSKCYNKQTHIFQMYNKQTFLQKHLHCFNID